MLFHPAPMDRLSLQADRLRLSHLVTPALISNVIDGASRRLAEPGPSDKAAQLGRLIEAGAWTDTTLTLIALGLPQWTLRRLVYDGGEWLCSLSKHPDLPLEFDDMAEARHESMALALLNAFVEARQQDIDAHEIDLQTVPQVRPAMDYAICCDNFA